MWCAAAYVVPCSLGRRAAGSGEAGFDKALAERQMQRALALERAMGLEPSRAVAALTDARPPGGDAELLARDRCK